MNELWDAYDENFNKIKDVVLIRGENIPDGMYHLVTEIIVKHIDGSILITQRDPKKHLGLLWEVSAGGSALKGESPIECARRELKEETGIEAKNIKELARLTNHNSHSIYFEYLCITDCDKSSIVLQEGENVDYKCVSIDELKKMNINMFATDRFIKFLDIINQ